ncbi:MAG: hypothetical protein ACI8QS_003576 [Planctomycetota bacterium]|jgi:hypothetical protein
MSDHDKPRSFAVLDDNLARLIGRAYVPARPAPEFRTQLIRVARAEVRRHGEPLSAPQFRKTRAPLVTLLVAASLLLAFGLTWLINRDEASLTTESRQAQGDENPGENGSGGDIDPLSSPDGSGDGADGRTPDEAPLESAADNTLGSREPDTQVPDEDSGDSTQQSSETLLVRVTDEETGLPIEVVSLGLVSKFRPRELQQTERRESSSSLGQHNFDALPEGEHSLYVFAEGYALWSGPLQQFDPEQFDPEQPRVIDLELSRGGSVHGYVVDPVSGNPIAGARVAPREDVPSNTVAWNLRQQGAWLPVAATTGADGSFHLPHVSAGTRELHIAADDYAPRFVANLTVTEGESLLLVPLELEQEAALEGVVLDDNGAPLAGERLIVSPFASGGSLDLFGMALTDADGRYRIGELPAGMHFVILIPSKAGKAPDVRPFQASHGETADVSFVPRPTGALLTGVLFDADGGPAVERNIALVGTVSSDSLGTESFRASSTSRSGAFRFDGVGPGSYDFFVLIDGKQVTVVGSVEIGQEELRDIEFHMEPSSARGRVLRASDRDLVEAATVHIYSLPAGGTTPVFAAESFTDAKGEWTCVGLKGGRYFLVIYPEQSGALPSSPLGIERSPIFELRVDNDGEGGVLDFGPTELFPGRNVRLEISGWDGRARSESRVIISCADGIGASPTSFHSLNEEGALLVFGLAPGIYKATLLAPDGSQDVHEFSVAGGDGSLQHIVLQ